MKYRLKKDLPFIDKGTIIHMNKTSSNEERYYLNSGEFWVSDLGFDSLIAQNWIEEVKPRELTLVFRNPCKNICEVFENGKPVEYSIINFPKTLKVKEIIE